MIKTTLKTGAIGNGEAQYVKYVENIVVKLTENAELFPEIGPLLADLEGALTVFKQAQADAAYRDRRFIVIKNQALTALKDTVYYVSLHVSAQAKGNAALILAAGFNPSEPRSSTSDPAPKPESLLVEVNTHVPGVIDLKTRYWKDKIAYQFEYRKKGSEVSWNRIVSSKSRITLSGLESIQQYEFRVAYIGRNPQMTYSDIVSSYVL